MISKGIDGFEARNAMQIFSDLYHWGAHLPPSGLYLFVFAWLFIESTGFPISDEPLLLLAGYLSTQGHVVLALTIGIALVGKVAASVLAFWIGHYINLERFARPEKMPDVWWQRTLRSLQPTLAAVQATEERVRKQGAWGVFFGRLIPVVRSFISYPAGALQMPFPTFLWATTAGSLLWITIWTVLGAVLGKSYQQAFARWGAITPYILIALLAALVVLWIWNHRRAEAAAIRAQAERIAEAARQAEAARRARKHSAAKTTHHARTTTSLNATTAKKASVSPASKPRR
jgi:membrane protein DedA with SNARE-associated domain